MAFTSKDVARAAGVSQSTVSYVMSGKRPVSRETRERVMAAMEQLTYQPNAGARALAGRRTNVIGLVVPFTTNPVGVLPFIETIASTARSHDHEVLLVTSDEGSAGLRRLAGRALCDAIVMMDVLADDERVPVAASLGIPVVLIGLPDDPAGLRCIDLDFALGARMAVEELAKTGHDRITVIGYADQMNKRGQNFVPRFLDAAQKAARRLKVPLEILAPVEPGRAGGVTVVDQLLARPVSDRHGVIVAWDQVIRPVLQAFSARHVIPGRDISVIGLCTDADAEESDLTNVSEEPRDVSRRAMETLFWLLEPTPGVPPPPISLVRPRLTRRSTVMPAVRSGNRKGVPAA